MHSSTKIGAARGKQDQGFDYLLLSDIHLGSDIVQHLRPWAVNSWLLRGAEVDARLLALFEHYRERCVEGRRWRMVIAGDFLDLVGVSLTPRPSEVQTPPTREEQLHGLGSASDHVVQKVRAIAARHPSVFAALMRFVAAGHELVIVRGNHDIELHWRAAQRALIEAIVSHADAQQRAELEGRIRICPWFFAVDGLLYVEHGHEFDPMCSYGEPLLPTCVRDPRRIRSTPFSVLLRQVARPTRGLSSAAYDYVGMGAYMTLLCNLGARGSAQIAVRYTRASYRLISECFARAVDGGRARMRRTRALLRSFARTSGVSEAQLEQLRGLYVQPAFKSVDVVVRSLYLDRIVAVLLAGGLLATAAYVAPHAGLTAAGLYAVPAAALGGFAWIGRGCNTPPKASLQQGAERIAELFHTRWVVMGHTHQPVCTELASGSRYVNLGSWGADDPPDERQGGHESSCTYLLLQRTDGAYAASFMRWDERDGPQPVRADLPA